MCSDNFDSLLTTAHVADACLRLGIEVRAVPLRPVRAGLQLRGRAVPVRHYGSVDVFLEALDLAPTRSVLVVDNEGRRDEGCIGDLIALETALADLAGIVIWGYHRDTAEIKALELPLFSLGATPNGPVRLEKRDDQAFDSAIFGGFKVTSADYVIADDDGVLVVPAHALGELEREGRRIRETERRQFALARGGMSLRKQLRLAEFQERRRREPDLTFREHLRALGAAIEE